MLGSTTLDIVIGLVLVYLLYSLLVTILGELVATWIGIRARLLSRAIVNMLNDDFDLEKTNFIRRACRVIDHLRRSFFITEPVSFVTSLAGKFYNHPSMKYLSTGKTPGLFSESKGKPSYISNRNFSETLVHIIRDEGNGNTDELKISSALQIITDAIEQKAKAKANGSPLPAVPLNAEPETFKHINNLWIDAKGDVEVFKKNLEKWFDDTMDRVTGWFKRRMKLILFVLGFLIAMSFNVNSIGIVRHLSKDKDARNQLVAMGVAMAHDTARYSKGVMQHDTGLSKGLLDTAYHKVEKDIDDANQILALGWNLNNRNHECLLKKEATKDLNILFSKRKNFLSLKDTYTDKAKIYSDSAEYFSSSMLSDDEQFKLHFDKTKKQEYSDKRNLDSLKLKVYDARQKRFVQLAIQQQDSLNKNLIAFDSAAGVHCTSVQMIEEKDNHYEIHGQRPLTIPEKLCFVAWRPWVSGESFLGFFLTALAISLGSSFWFDLLKKLVSIRGTGVKPEEKEVKKE